MSVFRSTGMTSEVIDRMVMPGDLMVAGESALAGQNTTVGAGTWTGSQIATGIIYRSGSTGAYTDTTDTSTNIMTALTGNSQGAVVVPGTSFRLLVQNSVAFALTWAPGTGIVTGNGTLNIAASSTREYLVTILNGSQQQLLQCSTNSTTAVTFQLPPNAAAFPLVGSNGLNGSVTITPGMTVSGTGITAGTTVVGVTQGQGGMVGVTLSAVATATGSAALTFLPTVKFDGLRSTTL